MTKTIFFDEAGNTGQNLLDDVQQLFVLSSIDYSEKESQELLENISTDVNKEFHFVKLKRNIQGQDGIINLLSSSNITPEHIKVALYHKQFMIFGKVVDLLVEPLAKKTGFDIYKDEAQVALANLLYICMQSFCGVDATNHFKIKFINMIREQSYDSKYKFYYHLERMNKVCDKDDFKTIIGMLLATKQYIDEMLKYLDKATLDPAIASFVHLVMLWGDELNVNFQTVHDKSKIIESYQEHLIRLMDQSMESHVVGYGNRSNIFPLKATNLVLKDSKDSYALQVADVIAGSVYHWGNGLFGIKPRDEFWERLNELDLLKYVSATMLPSKDIFTNNTSKNNNEGTNPADAMEEYIKKQTKLDSGNDRI